MNRNRREYLLSAPFYLHKELLFVASINRIYLTTF
jgi:hypothetical protein